MNVIVNKVYEFAYCHMTSSEIIIYCYSCSVSYTVPESISTFNFFELINFFLNQIISNPFRLATSTRSIYVIYLYVFMPFIDFNFIIFLKFNFLFYIIQMCRTIININIFQISYCMYTSIFTQCTNFVNNYRWFPVVIIYFITFFYVVNVFLWSPSTFFYMSSLALINRQFNKITKLAIDMYMFMSCIRCYLLTCN